MNTAMWKELTLFQFRAMLRNRIAFFFNLVMPLIFLLIFGNMYQNQPGALDFLMPGELTQMLITGGVITVAIWLSSNRQSGALRHLFATPLPVGRWLAGRVLANLLLTALQTAVLYGAAIAVMHVSAPSNPLSTAVVIIVAAVCMLSIGMVVGVFAPSPDSAMPVAMILYMAMAFFGNAMMPMENAPAFITSISRVMPSRFMTDALRATMMQGKGLGSVATELAVLLAITAVCLGVSMWRIRKQFVTA